MKTKSLLPPSLSSFIPKNLIGFVTARWFCFPICEDSETIHNKREKIYFCQTWMEEFCLLFKHWVIYWNCFKWTQVALSLNNFQLQFSDSDDAPLLSLEYTQKTHSCWEEISFFLFLKFKKLSIENSKCEIRKMFQHDLTSAPHDYTISQRLKNISLLNSIFIDSEPNNIHSLPQIKWCHHLVNVSFGES